MTIVEPGINNTGMVANGLLAPAIAAYEGTPVAQMREYALKVPVQEWSCTRTFRFRRRPVRNEIRRIHSDRAEDDRPLGSPTHDWLARAGVASSHQRGAIPYIADVMQSALSNPLITPEPTPADHARWLAEFEAAAKRPLRTRFRYAFIRTYKPVLDDATYRSFDTTAAYRAWCEANLPSWLGYGRSI